MQECRYGGKIQIYFAYLQVWEYVAMAKSDSKPKKQEETLEEFIKRINQKEEKRNGLKNRYVWQKRRH